jgi:hypothetical protein
MILNDLDSVAKTVPYPHSLSAHPEPGAAAASITARSFGAGAARFGK